MTAHSPANSHKIDESRDSGVAVAVAVPSVLPASFAAVHLAFPLGRESRDGGKKIT